MEKTCDCECHKLDPNPCMFCTSRHVVEPEAVEPFDDVHDDLTEPGTQWPPLDSEGFPF